MSKVIQVQERQDALLKASDLPEEKKAELMLKMQSYTDTIKQMKQQADALVITDSSQTDLINAAKEGARHIAKVRIAINKVRKDLGGDYYKQYKLINSIANILLDELHPIEEDLKLKSKFVEIEKEKKEKALSEERLLLLEPYKDFIPKEANYGSISEEEFQNVLKTAKLAYDQAQKIERDKILDLINTRAEKLKNMGFEYNKQYHSYSYFHEGNMELDISIDLIISKCTDEEWELVLKEQAQKLLAITQKYQVYKEEQAKREKEVEEHLKKREEELINQKIKEIGLIKDALRKEMKENIPTSTPIVKDEANIERDDMLPVAKTEKDEHYAMRYVQEYLSNMKFPDIRKGYKYEKEYKGIQKRISDILKYLKTIL